MSNSTKKMLAEMIACKTTQDDQAASEELSEHPDTHLQNVNAMKNILEQCLTKKDAFDLTYS